MVVLPAASRPTMRILISFLAKRRLNSFVNVSPISAPALRKRRKRRRQQSAHRSTQPPKITISPETKPPQLDPRESMPPARRSAATAHAKRGNGSDSGGHKRGNRPEIPEQPRRNEAESSGTGQTRPDSSNKFTKSIKLINELRDLAPRIR